MTQDSINTPNVIEWGKKKFKFGKFLNCSFAKIQKEQKSYVQWAMSQSEPSEALRDFINYVKAVSMTTISSQHTEKNEEHIKSSQDLSQDTFQESSQQVGLSSTLKDSNTNSSIVLQSDNCSLVLYLVSPSLFSVMYQNSNKKLCHFIPSDVYKLIAHLRVQDKSQKNSSQLHFLAENYPLIISILQQEKFDVEGIPEFLLMAFEKFRSCLSKTYKIDRKSANILTRTHLPDTDNRILNMQTLIGSTLYQAFKPFQLEGVFYAIRNNGRCLIGDEMGLGKTLQALGVVAVFSNEWPCLVICPSSITFQWRDQFQLWLPHLIKPHQICVLRSGKDQLDLEKSKVIICSYDLIKQSKFRLSYQVVICDESHYIKNLSSQRACKILPLLQQANRTILLSGTPALNKPTELYTQIFALVPQFASVKDFSMRYAQIKLNPWSKKPMYSGHRLVEELHLYLVETVMIRRLKRDVQAQLPPKFRSKIPVSCSLKELSEIKNLLTTHKEDFQETTLESFFSSTAEDNQTSNLSKKGLMARLFQLTGLGKIKAVTQHIEYLILNGCDKILIFAHHRNVMEALNEFLLSFKVCFVRVDQTVSINERENNVKLFQNDPKCTVALLSITACSHGLNLTAAGTVVFAELYWVPGVIVQAEDRSHRMETTHSFINVHYIIAQNTIDELIWRTLEKKWSAVTSILNGNEECYATTFHGPSLSTHTQKTAVEDNELYIHKNSSLQTEKASIKTKSNSSITFYMVPKKREYPFS
ncbi:DNA annealing helicase and endonuclease ZRANB3-like isoform X3 [Hylaeus volcanicus]|uniref:DNA annealing helicase and endonuclease ZRANB3-like isoform X3 n=1 Tax=Hylaeus volcanicus TaxID=313075 RepID=UPI0023B84605|nr:DNA annealing helicase and endonuclease ZRANB3-like isoform X3 [Hylaeus volcanicus]